MPSSERQEIGASMDVEKGNLCALLLGLYIGPDTAGNSMEDLQLKIEVPHDSHNGIQKFHFWDYIQRKQKTNWKRYLHSHVYRLLFTVAKIRKQFKCLSMDEGIKKMWDKTHTHTHTGILFSHEKDILPFVTTLMDTEDIMLRDQSDRKRQILYIMYMWNLRNNRMVVSRGW